MKRKEGEKNLINSSTQEVAEKYIARFRERFKPESATTCKIKARNDKLL
jgi:hypothetical protein